MKEIKAYIHANRIASVIQAIKESNHWGGEGGACAHNLTFCKVQGSPRTTDDHELHYSMDLGQEVINQYKLELICEDGEVDELIAIIAREARTGQALAGWILVTDVARAVPIG